MPSLYTTEIQNNFISYLRVFGMCSYYLLYKTITIESIISSFRLTPIGVLRISPLKYGHC